MNKKYLIVFIFFSVIFSGCSNNNSSENSNNVNLRFISWLSDQSEQDRAVADEYNKLHPNVTVQFDYIGDMNSENYYKSVDLMTMGNENMDIVMTSSFPDHIQRAVTNSYIELDSYFEKEGVNPKDIYSIYSPVNGKLYGIPGDIKSWFIMLNKNYLDEAGLDIPSVDWTWDDYREYAKKLTVGEGADKRYGSYFHSWEHYNYLALWSTKKDNPIMISETELNFNDNVFSDWLKYRYDLENNYKVSTPYLDVISLNMNYRDQFFNGKIAMLPTGTWMLSEIDNQTKYPHDFVTAFAPLPKWGNSTKSGNTFTQCQYYSISSKSQNPQHAYDFLRFYTTKGMDIKGISISAEIGVDRMKSIQKIVGNSKYCDIDSLKNVIENPNWYDNITTISPPFQNELTDIVKQECEKYLLGKSSLEDTIKSLNTKGNKIIKEYTD